MSGLHLRVLRLQARLQPKPAGMNSVAFGTEKELIERFGIKPTGRPLDVPGHYFIGDSASKGVTATYLSPADLALC